jgi:hypothetical protein
MMEQAMNGDTGIRRGVAQHQPIGITSIEETRFI